MVVVAGVLLALRGPIAPPHTTLYVLSTLLHPAAPQIVVGVRIRPPTRAEQEAGSSVVFTCDGRCIVDLEKQAPYSYDFAWGQAVDNATIYRDIGHGLIESVTKGYNG